MFRHRPERCRNAGTHGIGARGVGVGGRVGFGPWVGCGQLARARAWAAPGWPPARASTQPPKARFPKPPGLQFDPMAQRTEEFEQARLVRWTHLRAVRAVLPDLAWLHHSPNGGQRTGFTGGQMKALGTKPGFPDLVLPVPSPAGWHGLAIEMKSATGRTSPEQVGWMDRLADSGWKVAVCRSADEARDTIAAYFKTDPADLPPLA